MEHNGEIREFIRENGRLFWYVPEQAKENISLESVVETILNYGNERSVKKLFYLVGINKVAGIFYKQVSGKRVNYFPQVIHYFDLYFQRHARRSTDPATD